MAMARGKTALCCVLALGGLVAALPAAAQTRTTPVTVTNGEANPSSVVVENDASDPVTVTTADAPIGVSCRHVILQPGETDEPRCRRADTGSVFLTVPSGYRFEVTDLTVSPNALPPAGDVSTAAVSVGRKTSYGGVFDRMYFPLSDASTAQLFSQRAPIVVIRAGEQPALANGDVRSTARNVDARISGFLVPTP